VKGRFPLKQELEVSEKSKIKEKKEPDGSEAEKSPDALETGNQLLLVW
jgi:hypothetical protein